MVAWNGTDSQALIIQGLFVADSSHFLTTQNVIFKAAPKGNLNPPIRNYSHPLRKQDRSQM